MNPFPSHFFTNPKKNTFLRAFTLVELLAVIAIIGILAAIIIPTVGAVRTKARAVQCVSNMRQIGTALQTYVGDNKGRLPGPLWAEQGTTYRSTGGSIVNEGHLISYLAPYFAEANQQDGSSNARNISAFLCPAWLKSKGFSIGDFVGKGVPFQAEQRYFGINKANQAQATQPKLINQVPNPSQIAAFFETDAKDETAYGNTGNERLATDPVHETYRNYLFFDGSVRAIKLIDQQAQQERQRQM